MNECYHEPKSSEIGLALNPKTSQLVRVDVFCVDCQKKIYSLTPREVLFEGRNWRICQKMLKLIAEFKACGVDF